jgi:hypothetical protein
MARTLENFEITLGRKVLRRGYVTVFAILAQLMNELERLRV